MLFWLPCGAASVRFDCEVCADGVGVVLFDEFVDCEDWLVMLLLSILPHSVLPAVASGGFGSNGELLVDG